MDIRTPREIALEAEIRQLREQLARLEDQFRINQGHLIASQRLAHVGSWERDLATGSVLWSDEMYRIYGLSKETRLDFQAFLSRVHPTDLGIILEAAREVLTSTPLRVEYRIVRPDGEVRYIRSISEEITNEEGAPVCIRGTDQDITEQVQATELLRESEGRLRGSEARLMSAQRLANLGSWEREDATGNTVFSDEMLRILGLPDNPPSTLAAFLPYVHSEDRQLVSDSAVRARSTGEPVAGEFRIIRADGEIRFVRSVLQAIRDEHGTVIRVVGATQDITDLKRAQQESAARQKLESLGTLASGIAHDFNNLLGAVLATSELALAELEDGLQPREELGAIRDVALRGSEIVRQLMVYAGAESATVGPVDMSRIVREMIELLKVSVSKHALLETDLANDLSTVQADAAQIRQIVMNLVTNASEAIGDRDGVIRIATRRTSLDQGSFDETSGRVSAADYVQLEVSDTGCGMPSQVQNRVFDPFFTTKPAGHGLGLAIVDGIVRSLQGKIHVASELGKGTTFQISLPYSGIRPVQKPLSPVEGSAGFSASATVLVVEDEDVLRQAAAKALRMSGLEVLETANGSAAIEILRASGSKIDVILLDMTIPGSSSYEVAAEYAKARSDAKVILTSAYGEETVPKTMSVPQVRGFIRKPFHLGVLVETLRNSLSS
jgi:PAS domain S-box-containing protein